jgi:hypothetical protein
MKQLLIITALSLHVGTLLPMFEGEPDNLSDAEKYRITYEKSCQIDYQKHRHITRLLAYINGADILEQELKTTSAESWEPKDRYTFLSCRAFLLDSLLDKSAAQEMLASTELATAQAIVKHRDTARSMLSTYERNATEKKEFLALQKANTMLWKDVDMSAYAPYYSKFIPAVSTSAATPATAAAGSATTAAAATADNNTK